MSRWYLDTSAALKLVIESGNRASWQITWTPRHPTSWPACCSRRSLRRAAQRRGDVQEVVSQLVERVNLFEVPASLFREAGLLGGPRLRSLDALTSRQPYASGPMPS